MNKHVEDYKMLIVKKTRNGWGLVNEAGEILFQSILKGATLLKATQIALIEKKCQLIIYCQNGNIQEIRNFPAMG